LEASLQNVNVEGLMRALIAKGLSAARAVAIFGGRQGGRFALLAGHAAEQAEFEKKIAGTPEGLAAAQAATQMGGFAGAKMRLEGGWRNVLTTLFRDNEKWMTPLYNAGGKLETRFVEASDRVRGLTEAAISAVAALGTFALALKALSFLGILPKGAAGGVFGAAARMAVGPGMAAGIAAEMLAAPIPLNAGEDEIARQRKKNLGAFRWLGNQPPEAGKFTPWAAKPQIMELKGAARVGVDLRIDLADGFSLREIGRQSVGDVGASMPP
jgi:hypothetical protein